MSWLTVVLIIKIVVTLLFVALPSLFASSKVLDKIFGAEQGGELAYRLYGVAIVALLVGYVTAIYSIAQGVFPWNIMMVGIASNAGASAILWKYRSDPKNRISAVFFGLIALAFSLSFILPV